MTPELAQIFALLKVDDYLGQPEQCWKGGLQIGQVA